MREGLSRDFGGEAQVTICVTSVLGGSSKKLLWQSHKYQKYNLALNQIVPQTSSCSNSIYGTPANQVTETETCSRNRAFEHWIIETASSRTDPWLAELFQQQRDRTWYEFAIVQTAGRTSHQTIRSHQWPLWEVCSTWSCRSSWRSPQSAAPSHPPSLPTSLSSFPTWVQPEDWGLCLQFIENVFSNLWLFLLCLEGHRERMMRVRGMAEYWRGG